MVSILLPTYNRSSFLPAAIGSIRGQTLTDWELVIIDDGSTDDSCERLEALTQPFAERVVFHRQPNAGPYPARNAALDRARGEFIAFFDSDDVWLPHHLERCVDALRANADVDCVYAACRIVDHDTGRVLSPTTFEHDGRPAAFRQLRVRRAGPLHIFDDPGLVAASIRHGFYCGLQNAVFRARVFDGHRFQAAYRNEAEDRLFVTRALTRGHRFGYLTDVHVIYHIHDANSSGAGGGRQDVDRRLRVMRPIAQGYADLRHEASFTKDEIRAIDERLHLELFWHIGYALLWANGRRAEAIETYRQALKVWPWSAASWKTYVLARLRTFGQPEAAAPRTRLAYLKALSRYLRLVRQHPGRWRLALQSVALAPLLREHLPPQVIRVHEGFRMRVDGSSQTSRILYATGEYEPATSALIKSKIGQGDLVVDVGANIGYFTLLASSAVGASGAVMAFEPNVVVRERLTDNIRLNASNNVTVHGEALGPTPGEVTFYVGPSNDTGLASLRALDGSATVTVPQVRFDDLPRPGGRPVRLIKVDVEGAELSVIEGMSACLARDRPDIIMEVTDEYLRGLGASAAALFEHLHSLGYRMYEITESGPLKPIASADAIAGCPSQFNAFWTADLRH